jgi:hypothetical protein
MMTTSSSKGKGKAVYREGQLEPRLESLPPEILELIAFYCADNNVLPDSAPSTSGPEAEAVTATPPFHLHSLLLTSQRLYSVLCPLFNNRLYARIFRSKFDVAAIARRFGESAVSASALTKELQRRCIILKRIKQSVETLTLPPEGCKGHLRDEMEENLWLAFMMMTENGEYFAKLEQRCLV